MKTLLLVVLLFLYLPPMMSLAEAPPFANTIIEEFNTIGSNDPTTYIDCSYQGIGERSILDRRFEDEQVLAVFLWQCQYSDGLSIEFQVNPEFGSPEASGVQAQTYAPIIGRLPFALRVNLEVIWLNAGMGHFAMGTGGILIHTETARGYIQGGMIEEVLAHEASHVSLDPLYDASPEWTQAQEADGQYISTYGRNNPWEDYTESFLAYMATMRPDRIAPEVIALIMQTIPNKIAYFQSLNLNMDPLTVVGFSINSGLSDAWFNPATDGQGFFIIVYQNMEQVFVSWFTFDENGSPSWLTAFGPYGKDTAYLTIYKTEGGSFDRENPPATTSEYGAMTIIFDSCTKGRVVYQIPSQGFGGEIPIQRLAPDRAELCMDLHLR